MLGAFLGPSSGGSAIGCALMQALGEMTHVAIAVGNCSGASQYSSTTAKLFSAINQQLWNERLGIYSIDPTNPDGFSVKSIDFCITSGRTSSKLETFC